MGKSTCSGIHLRAHDGSPTISYVRMVPIEEEQVTQAARRSPKDLVVAKTLVGLAILAALTAATAGLILLVAAPESGSSTEATLGFTAAATGIATAIFAGSAAIYAQIRDLWKYAPRWVKLATWAFLAFAVISSIWASVTQMN